MTSTIHTEHLHVIPDIMNTSTSPCRLAYDIDWVGSMAEDIFDGVFDRFPRLKWGAIELGASWVPSFMRFLDSAAAAFHREERTQKLSARPSEIVRRQFRATPYPHEDVA